MDAPLTDIVDKKPDEQVPIETPQQATQSEQVDKLIDVLKKVETHIKAGDEADVESSDLDSSDTSDDDDDEDDDDDDKLLRLIEGAEDDDEMGTMGDVGGTWPATRNEVVDPQISRPTIDVVPETSALSELGVIQSVVESSVIIRAHSSAERQVVDSGNIVALGNRRVLGLVFEVFGPVTQPMYTVRFPTSEDIDPLVCAEGTPVFYVPELARMVDTSAIRVKGTDASNIYDEEVGSDTMDFSDDEAEMVHRQRRRAKKLAPPASVNGRNIQSYDDLYDADLGF
ncbi:hypothetical protein EV175_001870 [Coemansia sp. RSA 1933]|nr:hypothetical protein EV175_001870 [Coemansia sp. RSA 1933]